MNSSVNWPTSDAWKGDGFCKSKENPMELGMIGLGRMGTNIVRRLLRAGHQCVVSNIYPEPVQALVKGEWDRGNVLLTMP
jgi:6-phosphogluconate dehydrogenase